MPENGIIYSLEVNMNKLLLSGLLLVVGGTTLGMYKKEEIQAVELNDSAAISQEHTKQIKHIHFFNDGSMLSIGQDKAVYWNNKFQKTKEVSWDRLGMPLIVASSNDYIAIAHSYKKVTVYTPELTLKAEFDFEIMLVDSLCFVNDDQLIAAMSNGSLMLLDIKAGSRLPYILRKDNNNTTIKALKYNQNKEILHVSWDDGCIGQWDVGMREGLPALKLETNAQVTDFAYTQDKMLTVSNDEYMRVWQSKARGSYELQATLKCNKGSSILATSADGAFAAVGHAKGIDIFDLINNELIKKISLKDRIYKLIFAPDNILIAATSKQLIHHTIDYQVINKNDVKELNIVSPKVVKSPEERYLASHENFTEAKNTKDIATRIQKLKALLTLNFDFGAIETENALRVLIKQGIAQSYFEYAIAQESTGNRYHALHDLKNSAYLDCYDYAEKAQFERRIQDELNKIGLVSSLWFNWSGKAKNWLSQRVTNTLLKLTPILA